MPNDQAIVPTGEREAHPLVQLREQIETRATELKAALPSHISAAKFQRTITTAAQQNPGLLTASRQSLIVACMKAAQDGLLPDGREAALVPFKRNFKDGGAWKSVMEVAYIPMVYGVRKKILQARDAKGNPVVSALEVGVVYRAEYEAGYFFYEVGAFPPLRHKPMLELTAEQTTDDQIVGAYSIATMADGTRSYEFMRRFEIDKVREASQTGATKDKQGKARTPSGPWVDWFPEQAKKTVLKRHAKSLPQSGDLILEADDDEADDHAAGSAISLLESTSEAGAIEHQGDGDELPPHDEQTGELIESSATPAKGEDAKPKGEAKPDKAKPKAKPAQPAEEEPKAEDEEGDGDEEGGGKHPAEAKANEILGKMHQAETLIDLDRIYNENEDDILAMPEEIKAAVDSGYNRKASKLRQPAAQTEPAA